MQPAAFFFTLCQLNISVLAYVHNYKSYSYFCPVLIHSIGDVKEVRIFGGHLGPHCWPKAIEMVASNRLPLEKIITHTYPLKEFEKGKVMDIGLDIIVI